VNGVTGSGVNIINSNVASSSNNLFQTIVNGVSSATANIINSFTQSVTGNTLTTNVNGVIATTSVISGNTISFASSTGILTSTINDVIATTSISGLGGGISLSSLSATAPLQYNNGTGEFSITLASSTANGYLSSTDWATFNGKQAAYTNLTSIGSLANSSGWLKNNGSGTFSYSTPTYTDVGAQQANSNLSSLAGLTYTAGAFVKMTGANTFTLDTNTYLTSASSLTAGNLSGTIPSAVLGNSSLYIGTTQVALNRSSANLALTGITSINSVSLTSNATGFSINGGTSAKTLVVTDNATTSGTNTGDITLGTPNGLSLAGQQLSLNLASSTAIGALSSSDWSLFNNKLSTNQSVTFTAGGDISGSTTSPTTLNPTLTVNAIKGVSVPTLATGNLRYNGSAWAFDNTSYLTNITGLISQGTNVTITGSGTSGSPYVINAGAGGSTALNSVIAATGASSIANGTSTIAWNWALNGTGNTAMSFGETTAATAGGEIVDISTATSSTASPLTVLSRGTADINFNLISTGDFVVMDNYIQAFAVKDNGQVQIGTGAGSATPGLLVLDSKNTTGDPTGVNGAMYYNSNDLKFRCYRNGAWENCGQTQDYTSYINAYTGSTTPGTPSTGINLFARSVAGRILPAIVGPAGQNTSLQPFFGRNSIAFFRAYPGATTVTAIGMVLSAVGTATAQGSLATTNIYTQTAGLEYLVTTAATKD
jgi:hypothetical protein